MNRDDLQALLNITPVVPRTTADLSGLIKAGLVKIPEPNQWAQPAMNEALYPPPEQGPQPSGVTTGTLSDLIGSFGPVGHMAMAPMRGIKEAMQYLGHNVRDDVASAIDVASNTVGISKDYLMKLIASESDFKPDAAASTSGARGLGQFIPSTWLAMVKQLGDKYGYSKEASAITKDAQGRYTVSDPAERQRILNLRDNPQLSALMTAEYSKQNRDILEAQLGTPATDKDLHLAHFLGPNKAVDFIQAMRKDPNQPASRLFPRESVSNRSIFLNRQGHSRRIQDVYDILNRNH